MAVGEDGAVVANEEGFTTIEKKENGNIDVEQKEWNDVEWDDNDGEWYEDYHGAAFYGGVYYGAMIYAPPPYYTTVIVTGSTYYYSEGNYYEPVYHETQVAYQVVPPPTGAIITTLPTGCTATVVNGMPYNMCGTTYYTRVPTGYQVVVIH